jgi:cyclophilin family peptidyl-prolyl cis-trans isomerase
MAEHKAPTQVTIVPHEEKSAFAEFVDRHWVKAAIVAAFIAAFIIYRQVRDSQDAALVDESWNKLMAAVEEDSEGGFRGDAVRLETLSDELQGTIAGPWALYLRALNLRRDGQYSKAIESLVLIKTKYPEHPLVKETFAYGESLTPLSAVEHLSKVFESEGSWRAEQPRLFSNPEPSADAPRIRIQTELGDIVVALYSDRAPKHVANFIEKVDEGFYDGLVFHRLNFGDRIETGDPTTKDPESSDLSWGLQGAENTVEVEETGLSHFAGYLSASPDPNGEGSNGSLISLTARPSLALDSHGVVFGKVVEGLDVVRDIASQPSNPTTQRPVDPQRVLSMSLIPGI